MQLFRHSEMSSREVKSTHQCKLLWFVQKIYLGMNPPKKKRSKMSLKMRQGKSGPPYDSFKLRMEGFQL